MAGELVGAQVKGQPGGLAGLTVLGGNTTFVSSTFGREVARDACPAAPSHCSADSRVGEEVMTCHWLTAGIVIRRWLPL